MRLIVVSLVLFIVCSAFAADGVQPGEYVYEGGSGTLIVKRAADGSLTFDIVTVGANGHTCTIDGTLKKNRATVEGLEDDAPCLVTMTPTAEGITVEANDECRLYCGARASFDGTFLRPSPACRPSSVAATRRKFQRLYDRKQYQEARTTLEPLLTQCENVIDWVTFGRLRNDLAVTLHKLKAFDACRAVLEPLAEEAAMTDAEIRENYAPSDGDVWLPIVRSARVNLRLCGAGSL